MAQNQNERLLYIVVGGTGDLMRRKLLPALHRLLSSEPWRGHVHVLGVARNPNYDDDSYRQWAKEQLEEVGARDGDRGWIDRALHYQSLGKETPEDYRRLAERIVTIEKQNNLPGNRVLNVAIPPAAFLDTVAGLGDANLNRSPGWTRLVVEKPFGTDLASAQEWNALVHRYFDEPQIYRIDHYLGKETVQNLLVFRFSNAIFESLWNRDRIDNIQITVAESIGVDQRGSFFDQTGTLRDMVQNHLTQLLSVTAMELPVAMAREAVRDEKVKVLHAVAPATPGDSVFGQYAAGEVGGEPVPSYPEEAQVPADSQTETFVALALRVNNWRWQGVPFYLRTGKRLPMRTTQIVVSFTCPVLQCFAPFECEVHCNRLAITIEPDEGFDLCFGVKRPGEPFRTEPEQLRFRYHEAFGQRLREAYETLLNDVMKGDSTFFVRADEVEASWRIYDSLLRNRPPLRRYPAGSWGPPEVTELIRTDQWYLTSCGPEERS
jgi:glucose-6-phosphate 1-dehydrogenase